MDIGGGADLDSTSLLGASQIYASQEPAQIQVGQGSDGISKEKGVLLSVRSLVPGQPIAWGGSCTSPAYSGPVQDRIGLGVSWTISQESGSSWFCRERGNP